MKAFSLTTLELHAIYEKSIVNIYKLKSHTKCDVSERTYVDACVILSLRNANIG